MQLKTRGAGRRQHRHRRGHPEHHRHSIAGVRGRTGTKLPGDQHTRCRQRCDAGGSCGVTATIQVNAALAIATDFTNFSRT